MCDNCVDSICTNRCLPIQPVAVCCRCETPVSFEDVSQGYYAACPAHNEDLYSFEVKTVLR